MNTLQPPVPISLRCLAVLPAIIMLGGYALLGPKPAERTSPDIAAPGSASDGAVIDLPPVAGKLASQTVVLSAAR